MQKPPIQHELNHGVASVIPPFPMPQGPKNSSRWSSSALPMQALQSPRTNENCPSWTVLPEESAELHAHVPLHHLWRAKLPNSSALKLPSTRTLYPSAAKNERGINKTNRFRPTRNDKEQTRSPKAKSSHLQHPEIHIMVPAMATSTGERAVVPKSSQNITTFAFRSFRHAQKLEIKTIKSCQEIQESIVATKTLQFQVTTCRELWFLKGKPRFVVNHAWHARQWILGYDAHHRLF